MQRFLTLLIIALFGTLLFNSGTSHAQENCSQAPRLIATHYGRVTTSPNLPNRMRSQPGFDGDIIRQIPAGSIFYINYGPVCIDGLHWWQVTYDGTTAWTAEGSGAWEYWLEPYEYSSPSYSCTLTPRLSAGQQAYVLPRLPNVLRNSPGTAYPSQVVGEIPVDGIFYVIEGPRCASDGRYWWRVNYNGMLAWTAEGEGHTYWIESYNTVVQCPNSLPSRLTVGGQAQVTSYPNLPNIVRQSPTLQAQRLGQIPVGAVMTVLGGPYCSDNVTWWHIRYGNIIGWTVEGAGGNYWLQSR